MNQLAQINFGTLKGFGPLGTPQGNGIINFTTFISSVIGIMTIVAIIWFIFTFLTGAVGIISSGGDKGALESAKKKITTGIIGIVVVIAAIFIISLIGILFGIDFLKLNILFGTITGSWGGPSSGPVQMVGQPR